VLKDDKPPVRNSRSTVTINQCGPFTHEFIYFQGRRQRGTRWYTGSNLKYWHNFIFTCWNIS